MAPVLDESRSLGYKLANNASFQIQDGSPSAYNHNHRPGHDNRAEEDSRPNLADEDCHGGLEDNVGDKEHQDDDRLDGGIGISQCELSSK